MIIRRINVSEAAIRIFIAGVWIFHGLYSKILDGIPRHRQIVGKILGEEIAAPATILIGVMEVLLGCWILSGLYRRTCAAAITSALICMNILEIMIAQELLISALGMVALNLSFIAVVWWWAMRNSQLMKSS